MMKSFVSYRQGTRGDASWGLLMIGSNYGLVESNCLIHWILAAKLGIRRLGSMNSIDYCTLEADGWIQFIKARPHPSLIPWFPEVGFQWCTSGNEVEATERSEVHKYQEGGPSL